MEEAGRGLVKISEGIEGDTGCGYQAVSPKSNYSVSSYRVAHALPRNRPRGSPRRRNWPPTGASNVKLLRKSREIVTDLLSRLFGPLAGQLFTPLHGVFPYTREQVVWFSCAYGIPFSIMIQTIEQYIDR